MSRNTLGLGEGFDFLINRIRYIAYFLIYNIGITIVSFALSFFYFASKNSIIMDVVKTA